jgi:acetyl-CoA carboxylase biotin carboxyl carrier protein
VPDADRQRERTSDASRKRDHAGIARLTDELLPALIAKLGTTQLGELEVREGEWHVRLRRPFGTGPGEGRRSTDKPSRSQPGHEGHGHARAAPEGHRGGRGGASAGAGAGGPSGTTAGTGAASASTNGTGAARPGREADAADKSRTMATSPAVGIFQPGPRAAAGTRVRVGDALGSVNVLGVPQEVLAPADGIVGSTLVESGTAVEYGQELIRIELTAPAEAR